MAGRHGLAFILIIAGHLAISASALDPSVHQPPPENPGPWTRLFELRAAGGFKDNLLHSTGTRDRSAFIGTGADIIIGRLPGDGAQFNLLISADDRRFLGDGPVEHEDFALAVAQWKTDLHPDWQAGIDLRYLYLDEVIDTSVLDTNRQSLPVRSHTTAMMPNLRWNIDANHWAELALTAQRSWEAAPLDDFSEGGPKLTIGRTLPNRSSLQISYSHNLRHYDTRAQTSLDLTPIPGTSLAMRHHEIVAGWTQHWDSTRRWRTSLRAGLQFNGDNGPGYFDYRRYHLTSQLRYTTTVWEAEAEVRAAHYDFLNQTIDPGTNDKRARDLLTFRLRAKRKIWNEVSGFVEYEHEQSFANQTIDNYHVNTISAGTVWQF